MQVIGWFVDSGDGVCIERDHPSTALNPMQSIINSAPSVFSATKPSITGIRDADFAHEVSSGIEAKGWWTVDGADFRSLESHPQQQPLSLIQQGGQIYAEGPDGVLLSPISGEGVFKPQGIDHQGSVIVGDNRFMPVDPDGQRPIQPKGAAPHGLIDPEYDELIDPEYDELAGNPGPVEPAPLSGLLMEADGFMKLGDVKGEVAGGHPALSSWTIAGNLSAVAESHDVITNPVQHGGIEGGGSNIWTTGGASTFTSIDHPAAAVTFTPVDSMSRFGDSMDPAGEPADFDPRDVMSVGIGEPPEPELWLQALG